MYVIKVVIDAIIKIFDIEILIFFVPKFIATRKISIFEDKQKIKALSIFNKLSNPFGV